MATSVIKKMQDDAERLDLLRTIIEEKEEEFKKDVAALKDERDSLQDSLILNLTENGLKSLKSSSGDTVTISSRKGMEITNVALAYKWCTDNKAMKPDMTIAAQIIKEMKAMPQGFALKESSFIKITKKK